MHYTNKNLMENALKRSLKVDEAAYLALLVPAVETWIDTKLDTTFLEVQPTTRLYSGCDGVVDVEPCTNITLIEELDVYGNPYYSYYSYQWVAYPLNKTVKREVELRHRGWKTGEANVRITANFSEYDNGIPQDIMLAATRIIEGMFANYLKTDATGAGIAKESIEGHAIDFITNRDAIQTIAFDDPTVRHILAQREEVLLG